MKIVGIIPSRYQSSRFPGKPLADIQGKSMIKRVYEQAKKSAALSEVYVATDDRRIADEVTSFGGNYILTDPNCPNGTARCLEAIENGGIQTDFVINIQGDEPFINPIQINELAGILSKSTPLGTLVKKIDDESTLHNTNTPKVIFNMSNEAIYFSRQTIPFLRDIERDQWLQHHDFYKHIGIYAYRIDVLRQIVALPEGRLESLEKLEQLRWLENGFTIKVGITQYDSYGIDTPEDIQIILSKLHV